MQNVLSENDEYKTLSSSSAASITEPPIMKPQNGQSKKVSASENVTTINRPYGSMPNITTGDDTAAIQAPTAVEVQQVSAQPLACCPKPIKLANCAGPQMRYYIALENEEVIVTPTSKAEVEIRSPSVSSDRQVCAGPNHDGLGESDAKGRDFAGRPPRRLWCSMPNIAIHYTDKVFYETTEIECIAPMMLVSRDSLTGSSKTVTEPAKVSPVKTKRRSLWKRAKKFVRRVFCCAA